MIVNILKESTTKRVNDEIQYIYKHQCCFIIFEHTSSIFVVEHNLSPSVFRGMGNELMKHFVQQVFVHFKGTLYDNIVFV